MLYINPILYVVIGLVTLNIALIVFVIFYVKSKVSILPSVNNAIENNIQSINVIKNRLELLEDMQSKIINRQKKIKVLVKV